MEKENSPSPNIHENSTDALDHSTDQTIPPDHEIAKLSVGVGSVAIGDSVAPQQIPNNPEAANSPVQPVPTSPSPAASSPPQTFSLTSMELISLFEHPEEKLSKEVVLRRLEDAEKKDMNIRFSQRMKRFTNGKAGYFLYQGKTLSLTENGQNEWNNRLSGNLSIHYQSQLKKMKIYNEIYDQIVLTEENKNHIRNMLQSCEIHPISGCWLRQRKNHSNGENETAGEGNTKRYDDQSLEKMMMARAAWIEANIKDPVERDQWLFSHRGMNNQCLERSRAIIRHHPARCEFFHGSIHYACCRPSHLCYGSPAKNTGDTRMRLTCFDEMMKDNPDGSTRAPFIDAFQLAVDVLQKEMAARFLRMADVKFDKATNGIESEAEEGPLNPVEPLLEAEETEKIPDLS